VKPKPKSFVVLVEPLITPSVSGIQSETHVMREVNSPLRRTQGDIREITITLEHNAAVHDWSLVINGKRHEHITSEVAEALVECQMIVTETFLTHQP
jgi:hypothetical protein